MKNQNYSPIGEKLRRISSYRVQKKELYYWKNGWRMRHFPLIEKIRSLAVQSNNQELIRLTEQLELLDNRCFGELDELIGIVSDPKRRLDDVGAMQDLYYEFHVQQQYSSHNESKSHPQYSTQYGAEYSTKRSRIESKPVESNRTTSDRIRKEPDESGINEFEVQNESEVQEAVSNTDNTNHNDTLIESMTENYLDGMSVNQISQTYNITIQKVIKILVTQDVYSSTHYNQIKELRKQGKTDQEIAGLLHISARAMFCYTPYKKGIYGLKNASANALKLREYRKANQSGANTPDKISETL